MIIPNDGYTTLPELSRARRKLGEYSLLAFAIIYFEHYCKVAASAMHKEVAADLEKAILSRGARLAIAAPRGHAKSTLITVIYVLWCICYGREPYVLIVSDSSSQAEGQLLKIKSELESNTKLIADFPEVCQPPGRKPGPAHWRGDEIVAANGAMITALGVGKKVRGRANRQDRPTLIIVDDPEGDEAAQSAERREKLREWVNRALLKAGTDRTNVVVVGTILHYDSLLARLLDAAKSPGWQTYHYKAVLEWSTRQDLWESWEAIYNQLKEYEGITGPSAARAFFDAHQREMLEGTKVLWPANESYYRLMEIRLQEGRASFDAEKQNEPIDPASCLFKEESIRYWDEDGTTEEQLLARLKGHCKILSACDPSMGKPGRLRDDSAIVTLALDTDTGILYVLDAAIRRLTPDQIILNIIEFQRRRDYDLFGLECTQFQEFLGQELTKRSRQEGVYLPIQQLKPTKDKIGRIQALEPKVTTGTIRFSRRHRQLLEQLRQFPKAAHDDGPDALEMAVSLALSPARPTITFVTRTPVAPGSNTCILMREPETDDDDEPSLGDILRQRSRDFLKD